MGQTLSEPVVEKVRKDRPLEDDEEETLTMTSRSTLPLAKMIP